MIPERDADRATPALPGRQDAMRPARQVLAVHPEALGVRGSRRVRSVLQTAGFLAAPPARR